LTIREKEPVGRAVDMMFSSFLSDMHTCMPGVVTKFTIDDVNKTVRASVQPALKRLYKGDEEARLLAICQDIPVVFIGPKDFALTYKLTEGDECALFFSERAMATWLQEGGTVEPENSRKFDLSDAFCLAGLRSNLYPVEDIQSGISLQKLDGSVKLRVHNDQITARVGDMDFEITDGSMKAKPTATIPAPTDVKVYQTIPTPPAVAPGYVTLQDHVHQVTAVGSPTGPAAATEIGPP
jgi:hypothetical protein